MIAIGGGVVQVVPARIEWLEAPALGDDVFTARFGIPVAPGWVGFPEALPIAVAESRLSLSNRWGTHLFFDGTDDALVGFGGFKGRPRDGEVEIGDAVDPSRRSRGIATAVVGGLVATAAARRVRTVSAHTLAEENPSTSALDAGSDEVEAMSGPVFFAATQEDPYRPAADIAGELGLAACDTEG